MKNQISPRLLELLAPAANAEIAIEAIRHGADAVYIGPASHGARKAAANSLEDIKRVVDFAHPFGVKVYATVNTIVYDNELAAVEKLIRDLYKIGVDALIVQDLGILRMNIPPIALHASTQCDTRTPDKALFLQEVGFSQIVLARELTEKEIRKIADVADVPLESFVHGALCVSYSGRCHASLATTGRSANRGECAQICRWPFTLTDADGKILSRNRHLLSLKDLNLSDRLLSLIEAGISSFKIEGRLKDASYVKNIVAYYRQQLDKIIARFPEKYCRSSFGKSEINFTPQPDKSFNRGFTRYFFDSGRPADISSPLTPKSMGEVVKNLSDLNNGDGISYFNSKNEYEGFLVNGVKGNKIITNRKSSDSSCRTCEFILPKGVELHRTMDIAWQNTLAKPTATRRLRLDIILTRNYISAKDERGVEAIIPLPDNLEKARNRNSIRDFFDKFGNTIYKLDKFSDSDFDLFIPPSVLSDLRRRLIKALETASRATYKFEYRRKENRDFQYPQTTLDYRDNVANHLAKEIYADHGVTTISPAWEIEKGNDTNKSERIVMTTRHCILREMGLCLKQQKKGAQPFRLPLYLTSGRNTFRLNFDCKNCEMQLLK